jgi:hypothetical protein
MKQSASSFNGLLAAFSFLYAGTVRTLALVIPPQEAAEAGLPAVVLALGVSAVLTVLTNRIQLIPFHRLGRTIYAKDVKRSAREWIALGLTSVFEAMLIFLQANVYTQVLKSVAFFRTPRLVIGMILAAPAFLGSTMSFESLSRVAQAFLYIQVLLPLFFIAGREFSLNHLGEYWRAPGWESLQMLPLAILIYAGGSVLLMLDDRRKVKLAERIIPAVAGFKLAWFAVGSVVVAGTLGPDLLRLTSFPGLKYLQSVRTPGIERFDLILLFVTANVAAGSAALLGKGIALSGGTIGVPPMASALVVSAVTLFGSTRVILPGGLKQFLLLTVAVWAVHSLALIVMPRQRRK